MQNAQVLGIQSSDRPNMAGKESYGSLQHEEVYYSKEQSIKGHSVDRRCTQELLQFREFPLQPLPPLIKCQLTRDFKVMNIEQWSATMSQLQIST